MLAKNKVKIAFIGCGFVGGQWVDFLREEKGYVRGMDMFCYDPPKAMEDDVNQAEIVVICVPTPSGTSGECDLSLVEKSVERINDGKWVVIRSTVPPGTTARLQKKYPEKDFIFFPEFLTEARAKEDFRNPDRIIIAPAGDNFEKVDTLLYLLPRARALQVPSYPRDAWHRFEATAAEAELAKYFGNVMGALKVTLAEIFANACFLLQPMLAEEGIETRADYERVREMVARDYRIGPAHLQSKHGGYRGFGGYCFIKDTYAFLSFLWELFIYYGTHDRWEIRGPDDLKVFKPVLKMLKNNIDFFEAMLAGNKALLELQGLTEEEAVSHTEVLDKIICSKKLLDIPDYLEKAGLAGKKEEK